MKTRLGGPRFSPPVFTVVQVDQQGCYARLGWRVEDDIFSGPIKFRHLLFRWCVDKGGSFGVVALRRCLASVETRFCLLSFG
jgi:hypothetical protein